MTEDQYLRAVHETETNAPRRKQWQCGNCGRLTPTFYHSTLCCGVSTVEMNAEEKKFPRNIVDKAAPASDLYGVPADVLNQFRFLARGHQLRVELAEIALRDGNLAEFWKQSAYAGYVRKSLDSLLSQTPIGGASNPT